MRKDNRLNGQIRPLRLIPHFTKNPLGSVFVEWGQTRVICTAHLEETLPTWIRQQKCSHGWVSVEYSMLPGSTHTRSRRERNFISGRTQEIQRLVGRSLRGVLDLKKISEMSFVVDCDVIEADGGTRTASIIGGYVALKLAINSLLQKGKIKIDPFIDGVAAVSVGIKGDDYLVDLDYSEDSQADVDMNIVMTHNKRILEIQGTGEKSSFDRKNINTSLDMAEHALDAIFDLQRIAEDGLEAQG